MNYSAKKSSIMTIKKKEMLNTFILHWLRKPHFLLPFQLHLTRLSLVCVILWYKYHIKICFFSSIFGFQKPLFHNMKPLLIRELYIELSVNWPCWCRLYLNMSLLSLRWTCPTVTRLCHVTKILQLSVLRIETLSGTKLNTEATVSFLWYYIEKVNGLQEWYSLPTYLPNRICCPSFT